MTVSKPILATLIAGTLATGGAVSNLSQPINSNYADTGTRLVTYIQGNEVAVDKSSPTVTLKKWNGQEQLGIKVGNSSTASAAVGVTTEVDNPIGNGQSVKMEPTADGQGFNVDILLSSKPASNVFTYTFTGYEDMDFFYQAPLWQEAGLEAPTATCTETDCSIDGDAIHRPDNIVNSYAVYSKSHKDHIIGQTNYATGKLFHIYRPQAIDVNGSTTWATLGYLKGVLSITVPQSFLTNAVYPVTIDPTFGYTTAGGTADNTANNIRCTVATPASSGTVTDIQVFGFNLSQVGSTVKTAIYQDSGAHLQSPQSNEITPLATNAWSVFTFSGPTITGGTTYDICVWGKTSNVGPVYALDAGSAGSGNFEALTYTASWPDPATFTTSSNKRSIYADYTASGGGSTPSQHQVIITQ